MAAGKSPCWRTWAGTYAERQHATKINFFLTPLWLTAPLRRHMRLAALNARKCWTFSCKLSCGDSAFNVIILLQSCVDFHQSKYTVLEWPWHMICQISTFLPHSLLTLNSATCLGLYSGRPAYRNEWSVHIKFSYFYSESETSSCPKKLVIR